MFGDNHDIPAFRWYDKDEQKLYVSSKDATAINTATRTATASCGAGRASTTC